MATVEATGSGDWSAVIPAYVAGDTVKPASYTVAIDTDITTACILDNTSTGGGFTVAAAQTLAVTLVGGTAALLVCNHTTGTVAITGNITGGSGATCYGVNNANTGTLAITGNVLGGANATAYGVYNAAAGSVTISGASTANGTTIGAYNYAGGTITTGSAQGGTAAAMYGIQNAGAGFVIVTGNATGGSNGTAYGAYNSGIGSVAVYGRAITATAVGAFNGGNGAVTVFGDVGLRTNFVLCEDDYADIALWMRYAVSTKTATGIAIAAPPAGKRIAIAYLRLGRTTAVSTAVACTLTAGALKIDLVALSDAANQVVVVDAQSPMQMIMLPVATALTLTLGAAYSTEFSARFLLVDAEQD